MNTKSRLYVRHEKKIIEMNAIFAREMVNPFSDEYQKLQEVRRDNPTFTVAVRKIKKNSGKITYNGLTYKYMKEYITKYADQENKEALLAELEHLIDISKCYGKGERYPTIKNWFLGKFPEIVAFGMPKIDEKQQEKSVLQVSDPGEEKTANTPANVEIMEVKAPEVPAAS